MPLAIQPYLQHVDQNLNMKDYKYKPQEQYQIETNSEY